MPIVMRGNGAFEPKKLGDVFCVRDFADQPLHLPESSTRDGSVPAKHGALVRTLRGDDLLHESEATPRLRGDGELRRSVVGIPKRNAMRDCVEPVPARRCTSGTDDSASK